MRRRLLEKVLGPLGVALAVLLAAIIIGRASQQEARAATSPATERVVELALGGVASAGPGFKQGPSNCSSANTSCSAASFTTTGTSTAAAFIPTGSSAPIDGLYLPSAHVPGISANAVPTVTFGGGVGVDQLVTTGIGFRTATQSGNNGFACTTNGCRFDFGAGASDYASSDGTTVTFAGPVAGNGYSLTAPTSGGLQFGGTGVLFQNGSSGPTLLRGIVSDSAGNTAVQIANSGSLTAGQDRYIAAFGNDATPTVRARIFTDGTYQNLATVGTAASGTGVTANYSGAVRNWVHKVTVINTALTAAATTDVTLAVTPANSRIIRVTADVTQVFTGGALSAMTVTCGNAAGGNQYLLSGSVFAAQTTLGDVAAEVGAGLLTATWADFGTVAAGVPGAITVSCRFTCTGANCNAATQGSVTFYVEGVTY